MGDNLVEGSETVEFTLNANPAYSLGTLASATVTVADSGGGAASYSVGGSVSGLTGAIVLQNNGGDNLTVAASGVFTFVTPIVNGNSYRVTVLTQPAGQNCSVAGGTGFIAAANITTVAITCAVGRFSATGNMATARHYHTATLLLNGQVLKVLGYCDSVDDSNYNKELAMRRVNSMVEFFNKSNIKVSDKVALKAIGKDFKYSKNQSENRKVEVFYNLIKEKNANAKNAPNNT